MLFRTAWTHHGRTIGAAMMASSAVATVSGIDDVLELPS